MRDVAAHAGVSVAAVSLALNGQKGISPGVRRKVLDSCQTLGYRLNSGIQDLVRSTRGGGGRNFAFVLADRHFGDHAYNEIIGAFSHAVSEAGYYLLLERADGRAKTLYDLPPLLRDNRVDALAVSGALTPSLMNALRSLEAPICVLGMYESGIVEHTLNIHTNPAALARGMVAWLAERGCRRIGFYEETPRRHAASIELSAFREALAAAGLPFDPRLVYEGAGTHAGAAAVMTEPIRRERLPFDGIVSHDYRGAQEIAMLLRARFGFGDIPVALATTGAPLGFRLDAPSRIFSNGLGDVAKLAAERLLDAVKRRQARVLTETVLYSPE